MNAVHVTEPGAEPGAPGVIDPGTADQTDVPELADTVGLSGGPRLLRKAADV